MGAPYLANDAVDIVTSDSATQPAFSAIYAGTGGAIKVTTGAGNTVTFNNVMSGAALPVSGVTKIWATGTTATGLIGLRGV